MADYFKSHVYVTGSFRCKLECCVEAVFMAEICKSCWNTPPYPLPTSPVSNIKAVRRIHFVRVKTISGCWMKEAILAMASAQT